MGARGRGPRRTAALDHRRQLRRHAGASPRRRGYRDFSRFSDLALSRPRAAPGAGLVRPGSRRHGAGLSGTARPGVPELCAPLSPDGAHPPSRRRRAVRGQAGHPDAPGRDRRVRRRPRRWSGFRPGGTPLTQLRVRLGFASPTLLNPLPPLGGEGRVRGAARTDAIRSKTALRPLHQFDAVAVGVFDKGDDRGAMRGHKLISASGSPAARALI